MRHVANSKKSKPSRKPRARMGSAERLRIEHLEPRLLLSNGSPLFVTEFQANTIEEYTQDGAVINAALISGLDDPSAIAVSGLDLFVCNQAAGTIGEYTTSGATVDASLVSGLDTPEGIAVSGLDLFVLSFSGTIGEYTTSGATVDASLVSGLLDPEGIAISGSNLFVSSDDPGTIGEYTTSGATVDAALVSGLDDPGGIAVSGLDLFVLSGYLGIDTIGEYTTSGATVDASLVSGFLFDPEGIAVSGSDLFVCDSGFFEIGEYTTSGATVNPSLVSRLNTPTGICITNSGLNVTNATSGEDMQTTSGLVITPNAADVETVTGFQITNITGGSLFLNDGITPVTNGEFISVAQGAAGLKFTPTTGSLATGSFTAEESTTGDTSGLIAVSAAVATITVLAPVPTVTSATTGENVQSSSGLVITPGPVETSLIADFQITGITGGSLFLNDGVTPVTNGTFITAAQGAAGLKFTPTAGSLATGSFTVQDAFAANTAGLCGSTAPATVTVLAPTFENVPTVLHGLATVSWSALGYNPATITVDITAYQAGQAIALAADQPLTSSCNWNTTSVPNGQYELQAVMQDASGNEVGQCQQQVAINNTAAWYSGTIAANETWTSAQVNVVSGNVTIPSGVTVTLEPGAIVKFVDGTGITVQSGGTLNAAGAASAAPIIFTSVEDDTGGGDTNMDGGATLPVPGDWSGIAVQDSGSFLYNQYTQVRYQLSSFSGTLAASQTWLGTFAYEVPTELTIPSGVTLTIQPGAVVKFGAGSGITVQSGGQLIADGTVAQPIIFTSINDGSYGGDTNGGALAPAPGDWGQILVNGSANFDHVDVFYGSGAGNTGITSGAILDSGGTVAFSDGIIGNALYDGLDTVDSGNTTISNSLFTDTDRAVVCTYGGSTVSIVNSTFDGNVIGMYAHDVGSISAANCIVTNSQQIGVETDSAGELSFTYSDVWTTVAGAVNYSGMTDPTGTNGDISANPKYVNAAGGNYRLNYLSPGIDSGNALVAPATDMLGDPMYNDPRTNPKTGVPNSSGTYADMGAYNFVESAPSSLDMIVTSVVGPATATAGGQAIIDWTDANIGTGTVVGPWHDSIYLVSNPGQDQVEILATQILVGEGVTLGPGQSCNLSATVEVPGDAAGTHYWAVEVNSAGDIFTGANTANTTLISPAPVALSVPTLPIDAGTVSGQFSGVGSEEWYEFTPQAGQDIQISLSMTDTKGAAGIYIGLGYMPSAQHYDETQTQWNSSQVTALVPNTVAQPYYVLVQATELSGASSAFTLTAHALGFELDSFSPTTINNTGPVTLQLQGGQLSAGLTYEITDSAGNTYTATSVNMINSSLVDATFDLDGIPTGGFSVSVTSPVQDPSMGGGNVVSGDPGNPQTSVTVSPAEVKCGQSYTVNVKITNTGRSDITLYELKLSDGTLLGTDGMQTITAGETWTQSVKETAGQYPPGSSNSETWTVTGDYPPPNATGAIAGPPMVVGDYAVSLLPATAQNDAVSPWLIPAAQAAAQAFSDATNAWSFNFLVGPFVTTFTPTEYMADDDGTIGGATFNINYTPGAGAPSGNNVRWMQVIEATVPGNTGGTPQLAGPAGTSVFLDNATGPLANMPAVDPYYGWASVTPPGDITTSTNANSTHFYDMPGRNLNPAAYGEVWQAQVFVASETDSPDPSNPSIKDHKVTIYGGESWGFCVLMPLTASAMEKVVQSGDPNDMYAGGFGPPGWIVGNQTIPYTIDFENMPTAAAPAAQVVITDQLSANLDWSTFQLQQIYFNNVEIQVPPGLQNYTTQVHVDTDSNPVDVTAAFNPDTGVVTWTMTSINPVTGQEVTDPLAGFLPPDDADFDGSGLVSYTVDPKAGLASDTQITGQASIVFDVNAAMKTPQTLNTVDVTPPTSSVQARPAKESQTSFNVSWSGRDLLPDNSQGAGIASYNVYVSEDGGPFTLWQSGTSQTSATFTGVIGHRYSFYSVATDNVGNVEATPTAAEATTQVTATSPVAVLQFEDAQFSASVTAGSTKVQIDRSGDLGATVSVVVSSPGGPEVAPFSQTVSFGPDVTSQVITVPIVNNGRVGESDVTIPLALSSPESGAALGSASAASLVIHDINPPGVHVYTLESEAMKIGKGKKAKQETVLVLQFSGPLNPAAAQNPKVYQIAPIIKVPAKGKGKHRTPPTTMLGPPVVVASAVYSATHDSVTLTPRAKLKFTKPEQLTVSAAFLTDAAGRPIDGNDDGQPGGNYVAVISKGGVTVGAAALARTRRSMPTAAAMVDALVERDELSRAEHSYRARREARLVHSWLGLSGE